MTKKRSCQSLNFSLNVVNSFTRPTLILKYLKSIVTNRPFSTKFYAMTSMIPACLRSSFFTVSTDTLKTIFTWIHLVIRTKPISHNCCFI
ncbi:hypothetical protein EG68_08504 [Paragonimus skrjabini miyazakii]|uniref:Uncharacterized protein n=1 Tax=Paragonimus skrjabini miyazakii TaxID=59628 RepID=A0A8S9YBX3_9TREM|nr:hypothetical protein EG68_08504 [Paragonimus skrjabini miyazakii]